MEAPAFSTVEISSASRVKSAERIDGAISIMTRLRVLVCEPADGDSRLCSSDSSGYWRLCALESRSSSRSRLARDWYCDSPRGSHYRSHFRWHWRSCLPAFVCLRSRLNYSPQHCSPGPPENFEH